MINKYPYSDMHELNADWLLAKTGELEGRVKDLEASGVKNLNPIYNSGRKLADFEENGQTISIYEPIDVLPEINNAGYHNSIYRGKFLGTSISDEQYTQISDGTFEDMFIGDYWTIPTTINGVTSNVDYLIAAFDYWWNVGDSYPQGSNKHHVVLVPGSSLYNARMNATNSTTGGYVGSEMFTTNLDDARASISNNFSGHLYQVRRELSNAVNAGSASGWEWKTCTVELMSEVMVYGTKVWGNGGYEIGCDCSQLPLFKLNNSFINIRADYWLRSVSSAAAFSVAHGAGRCFYGSADASNGIRPCFAIY